MSFAYLVYASAWLKRYHPAAFCAALLNAQPMGFYSPQSLVDDARRHGVEVRRPDINASGAAATLEPTAEPVGQRRRASRRTHWGLGGPVVRLGLSEVRTIGDDLAERIEARARRRRAVPGHGDLARRAGLTDRRSSRRWPPRAPSPASASTRREALWAAGAAAQERPDRLPGTVAGADGARRCPGWTRWTRLVADVWATGLSPDSHPTQFVRDHLDAARRACRSRELRPQCEHGHAGSWSAASSPTGSARRPPAGSPSSTWRTRPACSTSSARPGCGSATGGSPGPASALVVRGRLERHDGVTNLVADHLDAIAPAGQPRLPRLPLTAA